MNEPLSCVKCGAPRGIAICAYCGTRYSSAPAVVREYSDQFATVGALPGETMQSLVDALARMQAAAGVYNTEMGRKARIQLSREAVSA